jgi:hypothetical protein
MWPFGGKKRIVVKKYTQGWLGRRRFEKDANKMARKGYAVASVDTTGNWWSGQHRTVTYRLEVQ